MRETNNFMALEGVGMQVLKSYLNKKKTDSE
jgi:hypothetical protein